MKGQRKRHEFKREESEEPQKEEALCIGTTFSLHNDDRKTLVNINDRLYKLVLVETTLQDLKKEKFKNIPHVRRLNPISIRTPIEQERRNEEAKDIHKLAKGCSSNSTHVTSLRKAMSLGADVPELIKKLMKEKEEAQKAGDEGKAKKIRRQLRGLDYKRYINEK